MVKCETSYSHRGHVENQVEVKGTSGEKFVKSTKKFCCLYSVNRVNMDKNSTKKFTETAK